MIGIDINFSAHRGAHTHYHVAAEFRGGATQGRGSRKRGADIDAGWERDHKPEAVRGIGTLGNAIDRAWTIGAGGRVQVRSGSFHQRSEIRLALSKPEGSGDAMNSSILEPDRAKPEIVSCPFAIVAA